ncbi:hypothetical protein CHUAL_009430 [Chamberlinius hualienensis]
MAVVKGGVGRGHLHEFISYLLIIASIKCISAQYGSGSVSDSCTIPHVMQGGWFSIENGRETETTFGGRSMTRRGDCISQYTEARDNLTFIFNSQNCFSCVRISIRTINILEKVETECVALAPGERPTFEHVCKQLRWDQQPTTMFALNPTPVNCRASLEGVWKFAYQRRDMFTGECTNPDANITACQVPGSQFNIQNEQFIINYRECKGMDKSFNADVIYSCLGQWFVGRQQYMAVVNSRESRNFEKYRCFLRNRDDDLFMGASITPDCSVLKTPQESPERFRMTPVKAEIVTPGCNFPQNFTGKWINTAKLDAEVIINSTHIIETWWPDQHRFRRHVYVCLEQRDSRFMLARLGVDGCQKDYICFDFVPRHQNIIRFRQGTVTWKNEFHTVCSWITFPGKKAWKYDLMIAKDPVAVRCPVAGKFRFDQRGDIPFETRIRGGVTLTPRPNVYCKENISDFSVCDKEQKQIAIDAVYCLSVNRYGQPVDIYSEPDYIMKCVGYWRENLRSYLITMDEEDAFSRYRCWVYERADLNRILMSYSVGAFCNLNQKVDSFNFTEGSVVSLAMTEYERERDDCPMFFDDGTNPWVPVEHSVKHKLPRRQFVVELSTKIFKSDKFIEE